MSSGGVLGPSVLYGVFQRDESVVQLQTVLGLSAARLSCRTEAVVTSGGVDVRTARGESAPARLLIRGTAASDFTSAAALQMDRRSHGVP